MMLACRPFNIYSKDFGVSLEMAGSQPTHATHVSKALRTLNRLELLVQTMFKVLEHLTVACPDWLAAIAQPGWSERYARGWRGVL